jgi:hypothetical protein
MFWAFHGDDLAKLCILEDPVDGIEARIFPAVGPIDPLRTL